MATQVDKPAFNSLDFIIGYEGGTLSRDEVVAGFQHLINNGMVWHLQGSYGRMAAHLINQGFCHPAKLHS